MKQKKELEEHLQNFVKLHLQPGRTIHTIIMHRSSSGMMRLVRLFVVDHECDRVLNITGVVAQVLGLKCRDKDGYSCIRINGCGFSAGFEIVQNLSYVLHGFTKDYHGPEDMRAGYTFKQEGL